MTIKAKRRRLVYMLAFAIFPKTCGICGRRFWWERCYRRPCLDLDELGSVYYCTEHVEDVCVRMFNDPVT
jgi:hypothetical protein